LPREGREKILRRYLVRDRTRNCDYLDLEIEDGVMLRQQYFMGDDVVGRQLVEEAREIYYAENQFTVDSDILYDFIRDPFADGELMAIESLVRNITVRVNIHDHRGPYDPDSGLESWVARELRLLLKFTGAEKITIWLWGPGAEFGGDPVTLLKIREIAGIVKELINQFTFGVVRVLRAAGTGSMVFNPFWLAPSEEARKNFQEGKATMQETMQIQIEEWTRPSHEERRVQEEWAASQRNSPEQSRTLSP
jgi:hypothetical protein